MLAKLVVSIQIVIYIIISSSVCPLKTETVLENEDPCSSFVNLFTFSSKIFISFYIMEMEIEMDINVLKTECR